VAKEAADKYIAACVAPGTLKGYKKEWIKWLAFARRHGYRLSPPPEASRFRGLLDLRSGPPRLCGRDQRSISVIQLALCRGWVRLSLFEQEDCSHREGDEEDFAQAICAAASFSEVTYKEVHEILKRVFSALEVRGSHGYVLCQLPTL
jgi:hypothetical protein